MRFRLLLLPVVGILALSCSDISHPTEPVPVDLEPVFAIQDASRGFKAGFYWLPPMVSNPSTAGAFDPDLSPEVEICELHEDECVAHLVTFTMGGSDSESVRLDADAENYGSSLVCVRGAHPTSS